MATELCANVVVDKRTANIDESVCADLEDMALPTTCFERGRKRTFLVSISLKTNFVTVSLQRFETTFHSFLRWMIAGGVGVEWVRGGRVWGVGTSGQESSGAGCSVFTPTLLIHCIS